MLRLQPRVSRSFYKHSPAGALCRICAAIRQRRYFWRGCCDPQALLPDVCLQLLALRLCSALLPAAGADGRRERFANPYPAFVIDLTRLATAAAISTTGPPTAVVLPAGGYDIVSPVRRQKFQHTQASKSDRAASAARATAAGAREAAAAAEAAAEAAEATVAMEVAGSEVMRAAEGAVWRTALGLLGRMAVAGYYADVRVVVEAAENLPQMDR